MLKRRMFIATALACALIAPVAAQEATRPLTLVVPFPPGDALDSTARAVADFVSKDLGRSIIVDNKPGASGYIAADSVARSTNGNTFLLGTTAMMTITPQLRKAPYDPASFKPVARLVDINLVFSVRTDFPAKTWQEFLALAKQNPGKYTFASPGDGTIIHMSMAALQHAAGFELLHVPYRGMGPALNDFLGGQIDVYSEPAILSHIAAGNARGLLAMGENRLKELPNVPSLPEADLPVESQAWLGIFAPANTSDALIADVEASLRKALSGAALDDKLPPGVQTSFLEGKPFQKRIEAERDLYSRLIKELGIKLD